MGLYCYSKFVPLYSFFEWIDTCGNCLFLSAPFVCLVDLQFILSLSYMSYFLLSTNTRSISILFILFKFCCL